MVFVGLAVSGGNPIRFVVEIDRHAVHGQVAEIDGGGSTRFRPIQDAKAVEGRVLCLEACGQVDAEILSLERLRLGAYRW